MTTSGRVEKSNRMTADEKVERLEDMKIVEKFMQHLHTNLDSLFGAYESLRLSMVRRNADENVDRCEHRLQMQGDRFLELHVETRSDYEAVIMSTKTTLKSVQAHTKVALFNLQLQLESQETELEEMSAELLEANVRAEDAEQTAEKAKIEHEELTNRMHGLYREHLFNVFDEMVQAIEKTDDEWSRKLTETQYAFHAELDHQLNYFGISRGILASEPEKTVSDETDDSDSFGTLTFPSYRSQPSWHYQ